MTKLSLTPKQTDRLVPTPIVHQTAFWGRVHRRLGFAADAFDVSVPGNDNRESDFLVLRSPLSSEVDIAYVPFGPELAPDIEDMGSFLERLSQELRPLLGARCAFIRWDLPWEAVHARDPRNFSASGDWQGPPLRHLRELRMNLGTDEQNLWKAPRDILPPDTILIDLQASEEEILARMHAKTRYNVRLAGRRGVVVTEGDITDLKKWYELYLETTTRHGVPAMSLAHLQTIFEERDHASSAVVTKLLLASVDGVMVAGIVVALAPSRATYLYGASTREHRELMGSYAVQWAAIRAAKAHGCLEYDLFGTAPRRGAEHPLANVHRFKEGFGGELVHREGCWDFPFDEPTYAAWRAYEESEVVLRSRRS